MEVDNETNPSQMNSRFNMSVNMVDLNKKRKLEAEMLGLPVSKHQFCDRSLSSKRPRFGSMPEVEGFSPCTFQGKGGNAYDVSKTGSAGPGNGSNSFAGDSDSAISVHAEAKFGTEGKEYMLYEMSSSSSSEWGSSSQDSHYSSDGTTEASRGVVKEVLSSPGGKPEPADVELAENLDDSGVEYGGHMDYIHSGHGNYTVEQCQDKEIEEMLNSDEENPNVYVLSSGRWNVNQEARKPTMKPTSDQEFELYFCTLML